MEENVDKDILEFVAVQFFKEFKLNKRQITFILELYNPENKHNKSEALRKAGYSEKNANTQASRLYANPKVQAAIRKYQAYLDEIFEKLAHEKFRVTNERIILELARIAFFNPQKCFDADGKLLAIVDMDENTARALAGMDIKRKILSSDKTGTNIVSQIISKIKFLNKKDALEALGRMRGMFEKDNMQRQSNTIIKQYTLYPSGPLTLAEWEKQVIEAEKQRKLIEHSEPEAAAEAIIDVDAVPVGS